MIHEMATAIHPTTGEELTGYIVSTAGFIIGRSGRPLKLSTTKRGRYNRLNNISCSISGKTATLNPAAVILATFDTVRPSPVHSVDHIDGNTMNNAFSNLRWATPSEQKVTARSASTKKRPVICVETGERFQSIKAAAASVGRNTGSLYDSLCLGSTSAGYHWVFAPENEQLELDI